MHTNYRQRQIDKEIKIVKQFVFDWMCVIRTYKLSIIWKTYH